MWIVRAKSAIARSQGVKELASPFGGAPDTATVLRVFPRKNLSLTPFQPGPF
jgi:hypothetical protein